MSELCSTILRKIPRNMASGLELLAHLAAPALALVAARRMQLASVVAGMDGLE